MAWMCWWSVTESAVSVSQDVGRRINRPFSDSGKYHQRTIRSTLQICIFARTSPVLRWCEKISSLCYFLSLLCNPFVILIFMGICFVLFDLTSSPPVLFCRASSLQRPIPVFLHVAAHLLWWTSQLLLCFTVFSSININGRMDSVDDN